MKKSLIRIMASIALLTIGGASFAQSSCTAKNTDDTSVVCEVTCSEGETASCHDSSGGNEPTCECDFSGYIKNNAHNFPFKKYKNFTPKFQQIENTNIIQVINERIKTPPHHVADACRQVPVGRQCLLKPGHECNFLPKPGLEGAKFVCAPECTQQYQTVCDPIMAPLTVAGPILLEGNPVEQLACGFITKTAHPLSKAIPINRQKQHASEHEY
jgi:hypothetical protein